MLFVSRFKKKIKNIFQEYHYFSKSGLLISNAGCGEKVTNS